MEVEHDDPKGNCSCSDPFSASMSVFGGAC